MKKPLLTTNTNSPCIDLEREYLQDNLDIKPYGLWYEIDGSWINWCKIQDFKDYDSKYEIELDMSNILIIDDIKSIIDFINTYEGKDAILGIPNIDVGEGISKL